MAVLANHPINIRNLNCNGSTGKLGKEEMETMGQAKNLKLFGEESRLPCYGLPNYPG